ncbi:MAG: hypothetical protein ACYSW4_06965, partial [Planctomycetota bacterium]
MKHQIYCLAITLLSTAAHSAMSAEMPTTSKYTNSIGMKFVRIGFGSFQMGQLRKPLPHEILPIFRGRGKFDLLTEGDFDEK